MSKNLPDVIDRDSYEPAYVQLTAILRRQIAKGIFRPGDKLPSEAQLCKRYEVSPMTVRRVVNILSDQGMVATVQGRGTYVKPIELGTASFKLDTLQQLFKDEEKTEVGILEARIIKATAEINSKLNILPDDRVVFIRRLISCESKPLIYHREYLIYDPYSPIIESEMEVTSLRGLFSGAGQSAFKRGEISIEAKVVDASEARMLDLSEGSPAMQLEHVFYDFDNNPVSWGWFLCSGESLRFHAVIGIWE